MASLYRSVKNISSVSRLLSSHQKISSSIHQQSRRSLPVCTIETNIASANLPRDVHYEFEKLMAKTFNKPQSSCSVTVVPDVKISRAGLDDPCLNIQIWSIGAFNDTDNFHHAKQFFDYLLPKFEIPYDRITLLFHPLQKQNAGHLLYAEYRNQKLQANVAQ